MWWLIPIGLGAIGISLIYDSVDDNEYKARKRWENKRKEVEKTIEEHQRNIDTHLKKAQKSYDFYFLIDLHYSSVKISNSAYQLLDDARSSFDGMSKMLKKAKEQKNIFQKKLEEYKKDKNRKKINETYEELKLINDLRKNIFDDRDKVTLQKASFLNEVKRLNNQTRKLKELIRDRCGQKGINWYNKLEAKKLKR